MRIHHALTGLIFSLLISTQVLAWTAPVTISSTTTSAASGRFCMALDNGPPQTLHFAYRVANSLAYNSFDIDAVSTGAQLKDTSNLYGFDIGCVLDSSGDLYISHGDVSSDRTFLSTFASGALVKTTLATRNKYSVGTALTMDASGYFHVLYYDSTEDDLKYLTNSSGSWDATNNEEILDSTGDVGSDPVVAVDSTGAMHIAYGDTTNSAIKYVTNSSGSWSAPVTVVSSGTFHSIAVDSNDKVHIAYLKHRGIYNDVMHTTNASGAWVSETVDGNDVAMYETSITTTSPTAVHIAYRNHTGSAFNYATNITGSWVVSPTPIDSGTVGVYSSLLADATGSVYVAYLDQDDATIKLVYNICGDSSVDASEECDDGNNTSGDGCSSVCESERGNGTIDAGEECDDGNAVSGDGCSSACAVEAGYACSGTPSVCATTCGDGVRAGAEVCDDGNTSNTDACLTTCVSASCGDSYVWSATSGGTESCDDGNTINTDACLTTCKKASCGDSYVWSSGGGAETCDDGNTTVASGDTCSAQCVAEVSPLVNAGPDQRIPKAKLALLYPKVLLGGVATDTNNDIVTIKWTFISVPTGSTKTNASITGSSSAAAYFTPDKNGNYNLQLKVTDAAGNSVTDTVLITVYTLST